MKNSLFTFITIMILCIAGLPVQAKEVYLSATGSDNNSGESSSQAVATLTKAVELADEGDNIRVSGFIDISKEPDITYEGYQFEKYDLTFIGDNRETSGFDAKGLSRILTMVDVLTTEPDTIQVNPDSIFIKIDTLLIYKTKMDFKNLTFRNGSIPEDATQRAGNGLYLKGKDATFENCTFTNNTKITANIAGEGGGMYALRGSLNLRNCTFTGNSAQHGGGLAVRECDFYGSDLLFEGNECHSWGGALFTGGMNSIILKRTVFRKNNGEQGGGAYLRWEDTFEDYDSGPFIIESTTFHENRATAHAGAIYLYNNGTTDIKLITCTMYGNYCATAGGAVCVGGQNDDGALTFLNCTIFENVSNAASKGNCGGIRFLYTERKTKIKILNCLLEYNLAGSAVNEYSDISYPGDYTQELANGDIDTIFLVKNSCIGLDALGTMSRTLPGYSENFIDIYSGTAPPGIYTSAMGLVPVDYEDPNNIVYTHNILPYSDEFGIGYMFGDPKYLQEAGITRDAAGFPWNFMEEGAWPICAIGATERILANIDDTPPPSTNEKIIKTGKIRIEQNGNELAISSGENCTKGKIDIISITGTIIQSRILTPAVDGFSEIFRVDEMPKGIYIVRIIQDHSIESTKTLIR